MDNATAVAYANHGAGRSGQLTSFAREIKESEIDFDCAAAALHIACMGNTVADTLSRFPIRAPGGDPYPDRKLRSWFRAAVAEHCGPMDVAMMSGDAGLTARYARFRSPFRSAFEGPLPSGQLSCLPRVDLIDFRSIEEDWACAHACLIPARPRRQWLPITEGRGLGSFC